MQNNYFEQSCVTKQRTRGNGNDRVTEIKVMKRREIEIKGCVNTNCDNKTTGWKEREHTEERRDENKGKVGEIELKRQIRLIEV